jgi:hypothetical protein
MSNSIKTIYALIFDGDKRVDIMTTFNREGQANIKTLIDKHIRAKRIITRDNPSGFPDEYARISPFDESDTVINAFVLHYYKRDCGDQFDFPQSWLDEYLDKDFVLDPEYIYDKKVIFQTYTVRFALNV